MIIFVETIFKPPISLHLDGNDTVASMKAKIQTKLGIPTDQQSLYFNGRSLKDEDTVNSSKIQTHGSLRLVRSLRGFEHKTVVTCKPSGKSLFPCVILLPPIKSRDNGGLLDYQITTVVDVTGNVQSHRSGDHLILVRPTILPRCEGTSKEGVVLITIKHEPIPVKVHRDSLFTDPTEIDVAIPVDVDVLTHIRSVVAQAVGIAPATQPFTLHVQMQSTLFREVRKIDDLLHPAVTNVFIAKVCDEVVPTPVIEVVRHQIPLRRGVSRRIRMERFFFIFVAQPHHVKFHAMFVETGNDTQ
eukprot:PhF_6_TR29377/c3_g1_i1/m.43280